MTGMSSTMKARHARRARCPMPDARWCIAQARIPVDEGRPRRSTRPVGARGRQAVKAGRLAIGWTMILTLPSLLLTSSSKPCDTMSAREIRPVMSGCTSMRPSAIKRITSANSPL